MSVKTRISERALRDAGCTIQNKRSGSGHKTVRKGKRKTDLPYHGGSRDLPDSLVNRILAKLDLNRRDLGL
ncbi:MAG: addiction module toxin, HicA family [Alphaproteobacteria bacterium]|jgi:mRNA interferase HicA|nr:addiction module toxin, HicA family [Alphaproteobacteria bacterium]